MPDRARIEQEKRGTIERYGEWTSHCLHLGEGVYTFDDPQTDSKLRRFLQVVADSAAGPLHTLRVLDLGCLEGAYGIELALHGAQVVAIEGREVNLAKARLAKDVLGLPNLELRLEDVRDISAERHGHFDVILCLGILYHLDAPDAMQLLETVAAMCDRVTVIDTHISLRPVESYSWRGKSYWGRYAREHEPGTSAEDKARALWSSLDNPRSFTLTRPSLCNVLRHVGYSSVYECLNPYEYHDPEWPHGQGVRHKELPDRVTLVAIKGSIEAIRSSPLTEASEEIDRPERRNRDRARIVLVRLFQGLRRIGSSAASIRSTRKRP